VHAAEKAREQGGEEGKFNHFLSAKDAKGRVEKHREFIAN
jgi:hypothetical protein